MRVECGELRQKVSPHRNWASTESGPNAVLENVRGGNSGSGAVGHAAAPAIQPVLGILTILPAAIS